MNTPATLQLACAQPTHVVIWTEENPPNSSSNPLLSVLLSRINDLENRFNAITATLIATKAPVPVPVPAPAPAEPGLYFPQSLAPHLTGLNVQAIPTPPISQMVEPAVQFSDRPTSIAESCNEDIPEEEEQEQEQEEEEQEQEQEQEEEEQEEEEGAQALDDFEWKGVIYYKDSDNQVYEKDEDGDLNDAPIGIWNEAKQKLQRYAKA
jgi:hypothetical protein